MNSDLMYRSIDESFSKEALLIQYMMVLCPICKEINPLFRALCRCHCTGAFHFGCYVWCLTNHLQLNGEAKEQIDKYFLDFLNIRTNKDKTNEQLLKQLDDLFQR